MSKRVPVTEYLEIDLEKEMWCCNRCGRELISGRDNYKKGCLVYERDPTEIYQPVVEGEYTFSPDPEWCRIIEFYCPGCGVMVENEYLPPGHPITHDIELDIDKLKEGESLPFERVYGNKHDRRHKHQRGISKM